MNKRKLLRAARTTLVLGAALTLARLSLDAQAGDLDDVPAVPPGAMLIEGDILVRIPTGPQPRGVYPPEPTYYWPGGTVPYTFHSNVSQVNRTNMLDAMHEWELVAAVQFVARSSQDNYLLIQSNNVNNSWVGVHGGGQDVNIASWGVRFIIAHELGHALGFWHEQSRSDRDTYVQINWTNIATDSAFNFDRHDEASHYGPYDFDSLMHYGQIAFSTNGLDTITVLPPWDVQWQIAIGQRTHFSAWDQRIMSFLYPPSDWRFVDQTFCGSPESGTFLNPYKLFSAGETSVPDGGTVWLLRPGTYAATGSHAKPMTVQAPLGGVILQ